MRRKCRYDSSIKYEVLSIKLKENFILVLGSLILAFGCTAKHKPEIHNSQLATIYYCPMHPNIQQDHPGKCPKPECGGMELIIKENDEELNKILKPVASNVLSTIKTLKPKQMELNIDVEAQGYIDFDSRTKHNIASKYTGRIDKLYLKYNYQFVKKGEKIFEIYSPELVTLQENLIFLLKNDGSEDLINGTKQKLKLLGFTDELLDELIQTKQIMLSVPVFSKYDGHVREMLDSRNMFDNSTNRQQNSELSTKQGMYVERGQTIFNIVNPSDVVVMLKIKAEDISKIKLGQRVDFTVDGSPEMIMKGKIDFLEPYYQTGTKTLMARVDMDNHKHNHKVGNLVKATIKGEKVDGLWIPAKAVLDLGINKAVWLKKGGSFEAHKIEVKVVTNEWVEVYDGLTENDEIACEAHYLNDSEGFVKITENE